MMNEDRKLLLDQLLGVLEHHTWQSYKYNSIVIENSGLTLSQLTVMTMLANNQGQSSMQELMWLTHQSAGTLTGIVDRLLEAGLIERNPGLQDRRTVLVRLTEPGYSQLNTTQEAGLKGLREVTRELNEAELLQLTELLTKLSVGLNKALDEVKTGKL